MVLLSIALMIVGALSLASGWNFMGIGLVGLGIVVIAIKRKGDPIEAFWAGAFFLILAGMAAWFVRYFGAN